MPHKLSFRVVIQDENDSISFSYECWSNSYTGEGLVSVQGHTQKDVDWMRNNHPRVANAIKDEESLTNVRYFENLRNGAHLACLLLQNPEEGTACVKDNGSQLSDYELNIYGQQLLDEEHDHMMAMERNSFGPQVRSVVPSKGPKP